MVEERWGKVEGGRKGYREVEERWGMVEGGKEMLTRFACLDLSEIRYTFPPTNVYQIEDIRMTPAHKTTRY
ncbi:hypothetical protein Pmani_039476 [Petrolisthes manimaculis]|uniref:Uncharacterized protein n=1 Tax=Petrolisthes manimaculis TaxID=1843537 RepID=A0AAE1NCS6_9EUCA|nr:hypothetical protein Pmani_039476 [Petrolisthes manimaculis]